VKTTATKKEDPYYKYPKTAAKKGLAPIPRTRRPDEEARKSKKKKT
jgi:hypothetical protein